MKNYRSVVIVILLCVLIMFLGHEYTSAQSAAPTLDIGVVNVENVLLQCQAAVEYKQKAAQENAVTNQKINDLNEQINSYRKTLTEGIIKQGTEAYMNYYELLLEAQSDLSVLQDFSEQNRAYQYHNLTQELYQKILNIANEIAEEDGLLMVVSVEEPDFPVGTSDELMTTIYTHKVLYSKGCQDITNEVLTRLNEQSQDTE